MQLSYNAHTAVTKDAVVCPLWGSRRIRMTAIRKPKNRKYSAEKHDFFLPLSPKTTYIGKILPKYSVFTNFHAIMA